MAGQLKALQKENAALWDRLSIGPQIKADAGVSARLIAVEADLEFLATEVGLMVERLRDAGLYEYSDPLRSALLKVQR